MPPASAISARVAVLGSDGRWHAPANAWMHGDELYDRAQFPSEVHYFHCPAEIVACSVDVAAGQVADPGAERLPQEARHRRARVPGRRDDASYRSASQDNDLPADFGKFLSADLHVHMNYGGHYRSTPETLLAQQDAEDLDVVYNLLVNKEERIPDIGYFRPGGGADPASGKRILFHAQEYHTSFWGHMGLLNLEDHYLLPDYAAYRHTALASPWPNNGAISDLARAQGALVGYVHIADFPIDPPKEKVLSYELPATVAHGKVDYLEVMGFSDHHITAGIWYRLLNLGFRLPAGAGTDAMANYASLRGPIGLVRVFLETNGERTPKALLDALKSGRTFVSNGPLLGLDGRRQAAGRFARGRRQDARPRRDARALCRRSPRARAERPRDQVRSSSRATARASTGAATSRFDGGGWVVLRAFNDKPHPWVLDLYPYATTSPIYFDAPARRRRRRTPRTSSPGWTASSKRPLARGGWNSEQEKADTLAYLEHGAREVPRTRGITDQGLTMNRIPAFTGLLAGAALAFARRRRRTAPKFSVDDLVRIANVSDLDLSPDGEYVVYSVGEPNFEDDAARYDLWRARWDGSGKRALTRTPDADEYQPAYSPDGRWIAFLSDRGDEDAETQVWIMPADGGEAEALTAFPGGVADFDWSPDSARLAVIANDPERPEGDEKPKQPEPIVIDRYYFKEDYAGWLTDRRQHLYLFEVAGKKATQLTSGPTRRAHAGLVAGRQAHRLRDQARPRSGSPPQLGPLRHRGPRRRARRSRLTRSPAPTTIRASSRGPPGARTASGSPTCRRARTSGSTTRPGRSPSSTSRAARSRGPLGTDAHHTRPRFTRGRQGASSRSSRRAASRIVSRIDLRSGAVTPLTSGPRFDYAFDAAANGRIAVLGGDDSHPYRIEARRSPRGRASSPTTTSG